MQARSKIHCSIPDGIRLGFSGPVFFITQKAYCFEAVYVLELAHRRIYPLREAAVFFGGH
jgi:hypothetical protein